MLDTQGCCRPLSSVAPPGPLALLQPQPTQSPCPNQSSPVSGLRTCSLLLVMTVPVKPGKTVMSTSLMRLEDSSDTVWLAAPISAPGIASVKAKMASARLASCTRPFLKAGKNGLHAHTQEGEGGREGDQRCTWVV